MSDGEHKPTRRERERLRHRQEILDATKRVVAARGVDGVTVEQVAKEAEYAVGSIYRHFRSKDELVSELFAALTGRFLGELEEIVAGPQGFDEKLEHVVQFAYDRQLEILPVIQAFFAAPGPVPQAGTPGGDQLVGMKRRHMAAFDTLLAQGQAEGVLSPGPRGAMVLALSGLIMSFARAPMMSGEPYEGDAAADILHLFVNGARLRVD